jgi:hypothetical protein
MHGCGPTDRVYGDKPHRVGVRMHYLVTKGKNFDPPDLPYRQNLQRYSGTGGGTPLVAAR